MGADLTSHQGKPRVLIAGGGIGALESSLALRDLAGDDLQVDIHSPRDDFVYRPYSVTAPFQDRRDLRADMAGLSRRCGAHFHRGSIVSVDLERQRARTQYNDEVRYDYLIVACGARMLRGVPGAINFWGIADDPRIHDVIRDLRLGQLRRVVFTMPSGGSWTLPLYELALLADSELAANEVDGASLAIVTPEESPLRLFGVEASRRVLDLLEARGIEFVAGTTPVKFAAGRLVKVPGPSLEADAVISLPRLQGRRIHGIPTDRDGFIPVNDFCEIRGVSHAYAIGDVTNFPVKQGGIAAQQADVAAEAIVADTRGQTSTSRFDPILRGVLFTGGEPLYLYGHLAGGHGESSAVSSEPLWEGAPGDKIIAKHLSPFLGPLASS